MSGHVFAVNGRIESVVHDAAIVPTDERFTVEPHWTALWEELTQGLEAAEKSRVTKGLKPVGWSQGGWGPAVGKSGIWFIDVGDSVLAGVGSRGLATRVVELLTEIVGTGLARSERRVKPLVAMPVLGIGAGGLGESRGEVIATLLGALAEFVSNHDIDIVMVTPDRAVYAAVQHQRRPRTVRPEHEEQRRLAGLAAQGQLALMIGAGASIPAGLPSWQTLIRDLATNDRESLSEQIEALKDSPLDQAEILSRHIGADFNGAVAKSVEGAARPSLAHALLAGLRVRETLTTNYDSLFEKAVKAADESLHLRVLPAPSDERTDHWLLKMHGTESDPSSIVLTRSDFVRYDNRVKPAASVLQAIALTRHVLMVGMSLKDDNVIRLLLEVDHYRGKGGSTTEPMATLLAVEEDVARTALWKNRIHWLVMGEGGIEESARELEIFLDQVAMYACRDSGWLLDERFAGLLSDDGERALAHDVRSIVARVGAKAGEGSAWAALKQALDYFGARRDS